MHPQSAADYNATRNSSDHPSFCFAPSVNMYFSQNGEVKACCHNTQFTIGAYPQQSIKEIWNGKKAEELRGHMRKYDLMHGCEVCELDMRLKGFSVVPAKHFDTLPRHAGFPSMMEFLLTNTCNLECVMCNGEFSSLIRKNREKLPPLQSPYDKEFLNQLEEFIPYLHETRFSGSGEAFMVDMNYEIWEMIIRVNPKCLIMVQTNGTLLTERVKDILERGNFQIGVSLDSVNKANYEAIRLNANFNKVMDNIRWFSEYSARKKSHFMLAMCVMRQNWSELPDFISLCNQLNAVAVLHKVWFPSGYALHNLPASQLKEILASLSSFTYSSPEFLQRGNLEQYRYFLSVLKSWMEDAAEKEKSVQSLNNIPASRLLSLVTERIKNHISRMDATEEEKTQYLKTCSDKLEKVLEMLAPAEREGILQLLCLENPAKIAEPLMQQPVEALCTSARKFLKQDNSKFS